MDDRTELLKARAERLKLNIVDLAVRAGVDVDSLVLGQPADLDETVERLELTVERLELKVIEIAVLMGEDVGELGLY